MVPPGIGFGKGWKGSRAKSDRRAAIARWAIAQRTIGDVEVTARTVTPAQIRALWHVCMDGSPLAEDCAVSLGQHVLDDGDPDDNVAMAIDRIVDAINARVAARNKEI
jgi:hypothetical protein